MGYGFIRLEWQVPTRGFRVVARASASRRRASSIITCEDAGRGLYFEPIGSEMRNYSVGLRESNVLLDFIKSEDNEQGVLAFVNKWGQLTKCDTTFEDFIWTRQKLRQATGELHFDGLSALAKKLRSKSFISALDVGFRQVPGRSVPEICMFVRDLRSFCWLELLQALAGPTDILQCSRCKKLMRRPKAGREPEYCSNACKQAAYRARLKLGR